MAVSDRSNTGGWVTHGRRFASGARWPGLLPGCFVRSPSSSAPTAPLTRGRLAIRAAFKIDKWLGRNRNAGVEPELHLPAPRLVSKAATLRLFPRVRPEHLTGGAQWYDYQMVEADRLTFAFAAAADRSGATVANYVEAIAPVRDEEQRNRIAGMRVRDVLTGREFAIKSTVTVNAAGAHAGTIMGWFGVKHEYPLVKVMSLLTSKPASDIALAAPASRGRMLTLVPWRGRALVGTSQSESFASPDDVSASAAEVDRLVADANTAFPALQLTPADVTLVHRGVVPAVKGRNGAPELLLIPDVYDHAKEGAEGAFTVVAAKYSSARGVAERVTSMVARRLGKRVPASKTATRVLPGAGIADHEALAIETARACALDVPLATIRHLIARYAERAADIITLIHERRDLETPVSSTQPTLAAEVVYVIRHEQAIKLTDVVIRRTGLGSAGHPGDEAVRGCARIAAGELKWDAARTAEEIDAVNRFYKIG